ncbi:hypothetical protein RRG08_006597 [Elysia crispata]|uniref:Uncharacterized protein n=1 Tax=Elysia crispata TaxID=231223 RepID=A0AAE1DWL1_9GAST|nr:hypothetical protein RRG08_006597 [Elysia crispata]
MRIRVKSSICASRRQQAFSNSYNLSISMKTLLFSLLVVALVGFAFAEPEFEKRVLGVGLLKSAWKKVKETGKDIKDAYDSGALAKNVKDFGIRVLKAKVASDVIGSAIKHSKNLGK